MILSSLKDNYLFYTDGHSGRGILFLPCPQKPGMFLKRIFVVYIFDISKAVSINSMLGILAIS